MNSSLAHASAENVYTGELPEGCRRCLRGEKSVIYVTGACGVGCYYCTIPKEISRKHTMAVNEIAFDPKSQGLDEILNVIIEEIQTCDSTGVGITGGDPILTINRTLNIINTLKVRFGEDFHIHLYTSGEYLNDSHLDKLTKAGIDEIRFHPKEIKRKKIWQLASDVKKNYPQLVVGFEIPGIPGTQSSIIELIKFSRSNNIDFVNINKFEFTDANFNVLSNKNFIPLQTAPAVSGSKDMVMNILSSINKNKNNVHLCSAKSKDSIQLKQRYLRRAENYARPYDSISDNGEIEYGQFKLNNLTELNYLVSILNNLGIKEPYLQVFEKDLRLECGWIVVDELIEDLRQFIPKLYAEIVCRYPIDNGPITWIEPK